MSNRGVQLLKIADGQIGGLIELLSTSDETVLRLPVRGREKLGDGTVAACASHTADNYLRIASLLTGDDQESEGHARPPHGTRRIPSSLQARGRRSDHAPGDHGARYAVEGVSSENVIKRLSAACEALDVLGGLSDAQLEAVPPASDMKFCDGQRTLEQIVTSLFNHQGHQVDALQAAVTAPG